MQAKIRRTSAVCIFINNSSCLHMLLFLQAAGVIRPLASTVIAQSSDGFMDHSLDR